MAACYPATEDSSDPIQARIDCLEARRRQWGICLGALSEALVRSGTLPEPLKLAFFREAGLAIYD